VRTASLPRLKLEFAPRSTPPGVASIARAYFKFSATPTDLSHTVSISPLGILAIGAIALVVLAWVVCTHFASRRMAAQAKELEQRIVERTRELTAVNEELRKDILERQRAQDALRDPEEKFHQLADNIQDILWMVDAVTKQAIYVNPAFEQITGRTMASLVEAPLSYWEIIHPDDLEHVLSALDEAAKSGGFDEEFRIVRPDGTLRWVSAQGFPIRDQHNNLLQQVMLNLAANAIDAMRAVTGRPRELIIRSAKNREHVLIQMQDSGKGIGSEQLDRIFEPFFTTKPQGIGLGLSISRSVIESLGGHLWATSASPLGATFHFTLPTTDRFHE